MYKKRRTRIIAALNTTQTGKNKNTNSFSIKKIIIINIYFFLSFESYSFCQLAKADVPTITTTTKKKKKKKKISTAISNNNLDCCSFRNSYSWYRN